MNHSIRPLRKGKFRHPDDVEKDLGGEVEAVEELNHGLPGDVDPAILDGLYDLEKAFVTGVAHSDYKDEPHTARNNWFDYEEGVTIPYNREGLVQICHDAILANGGLEVDGIRLEQLDIFKTPASEWDQKPEDACYYALVKKSSETVQHLLEKGRLIVSSASYQSSFSLMQSGNDMDLDSVGIHPKYILRLDREKTRELTENLFRIAGIAVSKGASRMTRWNQEAEEGISLPASAYLLKLVGDAAEIGLAPESKQFDMHMVEQFQYSIHEAAREFVWGSARSEDYVTHFGEMSCMMEAANHWYTDVDNPFLCHFTDDPRFMEQFNKRVNTLFGIDNCRYLVGLLGK